jgi:putative DNA-invertase from lambdoid prophage Rac
MQKVLRDVPVALMAAMAAAEPESTKAAQKAGIEHAKAKDVLTPSDGVR